jgi:prolyl-tRNA editing enzyme YbaK/EbsC (Cys-tRNA(Pro) deacylase)
MIKTFTVFKVFHKIGRPFLIQSKSLEVAVNKTLNKSAQKVQESLAQFGLSLEVVELPDSTRTAKDAAQAIGCTVGQIAKSLVFMTKSSQRPILVIASGANRVNEELIGEIIGEKIVKATAEFVRQQTGFAIGGVPPVGHTNTIFTLVDEDLLKLDQIWAAAGTPHAVFALTGNDLLQITGGKTHSIV